MTFNIKRSYSTGRSDLEFVGAFNEKFAGRRWILEFTYYSNAEFLKFGYVPEGLFHPDDSKQILGYAEGLKQKYPEVSLSLHVIYCFGNKGFRVFDIRINFE